MDQSPSVGRVVHYVSMGSPIRADGTQQYKSLCRAATLTEVDPDEDGLVGLCVLNPTGMFFHSLLNGGSLLDASGVAGGSWHWPERL
jgi:hypothetical protein